MTTFQFYMFFLVRSVFFIVFASLSFFDWDWNWYNFICRDWLKLRNKSLRRKKFVGPPGFTEIWRVTFQTNWALFVDTRGCCLWMRLWDFKKACQGSFNATLAGQSYASWPLYCKPFPPRILLSTWFWSISTPEKLFSLLNLKRGDNWPCHTCHAEWTW